MGTQLLGFPTTLGLPREAKRYAPEVLRAAGLVPFLEGSGSQVVDHGEMALEQGRREDPPAERVRKVVEAARRQKDHWVRVQRPGDLMLTIGGDHSTSLGTIWALAELGWDYDIVWIDAHGDFNVLETTPSGNPHGMVLSLAAGLFPGVLPRLVSPQQLHLWGIRDLDPGERLLLERERVEMLTPDQVRHEWERISHRLKPNIFLSFDIDSVDPCDAPGTMTPVPDGFRKQEALAMVAALAHHRTMVALDIVEYHPDRDLSMTTASLALDVIKAAAGVAGERQSGFGAAAGA